MADHDEVGAGFDSRPKGRELDPIQPLEVEVQNRQLQMRIDLRFPLAGKVLEGRRHP